MIQDKYMEREHGTVWGSIRNTVELSQKRDEEVTVTTLKTQVYKIEPLTKKMESEIWASIIRIKDLTYAFSQLCQKIGHIYNLENERSGREEESSFGNPQCIGRSQDKGDNPRSQAYIKNILNNVQERLKAQYNRLLSLYLTGLWDTKAY